MLRRLPPLLGLVLIGALLPTPRLAAQSRKNPPGQAVLLPPVEVAEYEWKAPSDAKATFAPGDKSSTRPALGPPSDAAPDTSGVDVAVAQGAPSLGWVEADYLLWWMQGSRLPPLVTASPPGTPLNSAGVLGTPGTTVLFGGTPVNASARSGGRLFLGAWLDECQRFGVEGNFLYLENRAANFASPGGDAIVGRPFSNAVTGAPAAQQVSFPGVLQGTVLNANATNGLLGAGVLARQVLCCDCNRRLDFLAGYRFLQFTDRLEIDENLTALGGTNVVPPGTRIGVTDTFGTRNEFHGFDTGLAASFPVGPLQMRLLGKVALGSTYQVVDISGATTTTLPGAAPATTPGGLLALSSNSGHYSRQRFTAIPEIGARLGGNLTPRLRGWVGYTWLYWSSVARAGDQIDLRLNPGLLPPPVTPATGPVLPAFPFQSHSFWAQGVDVGLEFLY